ncbi:MAG: hypothetical protein IPI34_09340 [bacterium]|nr:hypothetical protein [bacterium]
MFRAKRLLILATVISTCGLFSEATARSRHHDRDRLEGSGKLETRSFDLRGWDSLQLDGAMDIEVKVGGGHAAEVKPWTTTSSTTSCSRCATARWSWTGAGSATRTTTPG